VTYDRFDVVIVPFPYTDRSTKKRRPAVVLTASSDYGEPTGQAVMAMITRATGSQWPHDVRLSDRSTTGLLKDCRVRLKLFSIDQRLIDRRIGALVLPDQVALKAALATLFDLE